MKKISIIKDNNCNIDIKRVAKIVNNLSSTIRIEVIDDDFNFDDLLIEFPVTHIKYLKKTPKQKGNDEIVIITDVPYNNNFFFYEKNNLTILSFYNWEYLTTLPKENGLLYWICVFTLNDIGRNDKMIRHSKVTGCIADFLGDKTGIDIGMKQASICNECSKKMSKIEQTKDQQKLFSDVKILLDTLSKRSRWNESIFNEDIVEKTSKKNVVKKITPINRGEISVLIASPSDTVEEREILKDLDRQFRILGFEKSTGYRIITKGWEDIAPQTGYAQDIINNILLPQIDIVVGVLKHKLGTPTVNQNGIQRAPSGTAEELYYAIEKNPEKVICMLYCDTTPLPISAYDSDLINKIENLKNLHEFILNIRSRVIYQPYESKKELLQIVAHGLSQNISQRFSTIRKR